MYACTCVYALIGEHQNRIKTSKKSISRKKSRTAYPKKVKDSLPGVTGVPEVTGVIVAMTMVVVTGVTGVTGVTVVKG